DGWVHHCRGEQGPADAGCDVLSRPGADSQLLGVRRYLPAPGQPLRAGGVLDHASHLFLVSAWSARCPNPADPMSCINDPANPRVAQNTSPLYAWTDITYLLHKNKVSWKYYVNQGIEPECPGEQLTCAPRMQLVNQESLVNPLPAFTTVHDDHELSNIVDEATFATDAVTGNLPSVAWVVPSHVVMQGPDWNSTAIFLAWDDWGGFYDHVPPPTIDQNGYGIRVPGLLISPY